MIVSCDGVRPLLSRGCYVPNTSDGHLEYFSLVITMFTQKSPVCVADTQVQSPPPAERSRTVLTWMDLDWVRDGG